MNQATPRKSAVRRSEADRAEAQGIRIAIWANVGFALAGFGFALLTGSEAILLDGVFSLIGFLMALLTARVATLVRRPSDASFPFGYLALSPFLNTVKGLIVLTVCGFALVQAVGALFTGGRSVVVELAAVYGVLMTASCAALALVLHRLARLSGSPLVQADAQNSSADALLSGAVALGFAGALMLERTSYAAWTPYVDPVLVALVVVLALGLPVSMIQQGLRELLMMAPETRLVKRAEAAIVGAIEGEGIERTVVRVVRVGRYLTAFAYVLLERDAYAQVAAFDALRAKAQEALDAVHPDAYVDIVFTTHPRWVR
jgi:cation diffusion facilitator family transporter